MMIGWVIVMIGWIIVMIRWVIVIIRWVIVIIEIRMLRMIGWIIVIIDKVVKLKVIQISLMVVFQARKQKYVVMIVRVLMLRSFHSNVFSLKNREGKISITG